MFVCTARNLFRVLFAFLLLFAADSAFANGIVILRGGGTPTVWFFDVGLHRWHQLVDLPVPVGEGGALVVLNNDTYVLRGAGTREFYRLAASASPSWVRMADFPEPVGVGSALAANVWHVNSVYGVGGGSSTLWRFDIASKTWFNAGQLPAAAGPGTSFSNAQSAGFQYLPGGSSEAYVSDFDVTSWQSLTTFPNAAGIGGGVASLWNGCAFALPGGANTDAFYSIGGFQCDASSRAPFPITPHAEAALLSSTDSDGFVYATAGEGTATIFRYTVATNSWEQFIETPLPLGAGTDASEFRGTNLGVAISYPGPPPAPMTGTATLTIEEPVLNFNQVTAVIRGAGFPFGCNSTGLYGITGATITALGGIPTWFDGSWAYNFNFGSVAEGAEKYRWSANFGICNGYVMLGTNPGGSFPRTITLHDDSTGGRFSVSPASLTFPPTAIGAVSAAQPLTITNTGTGPLLIRDVSFYGGDYRDFIGGSCLGRAIEPNGSCVIQMRFRPTASGLRQSSFGIAHTDRGGDGSGFKLIPLKGGIAPDTTPPTITCSATPEVVWPPTGKMIPANITVDASDADSGLDGFTLVSASSSEGDSTAEIQGFIVGSASTSGAIRASRSGAGSGRLYSFIYKATDKAGNSATCTATITVPRDQRK
jgi:hypothetical protein